MRSFKAKNGISKDRFDLKRITEGWAEKLSSALALGYEGLRVSGNAFWFERNQWKQFSEYERELDRSLADQKMIVLCTYSLIESRVQVFASTAVQRLQVKHPVRRSP